MIGVDDVKDVTIGVDYTKPVQYIFANFVRVIAHQQKNLSLLSLAGIGTLHRQSLVPLPSWVPSFTLPPNGASCHLCSQARLQTYPVDKTNGDSEASFSDDLRSMVSRVVIVDRVTETEKRVQDCDDFIFVLSSWAHKSKVFGNTPDTK